MPLGDSPPFRPKRLLRSASGQKVPTEYDPLSWGSARDYQHSQIHFPNGGHASQERGYYLESSETEGDAPPWRYQQEHRPDSPYQAQLDSTQQRYDGEVGRTGQQVHYSGIVNWDQWIDERYEYVDPAHFSEQNHDYGSDKEAQQHHGNFGDHHAYDHQVNEQQSRSDTGNMSDHNYHNQDLRDLSEPSHGHSHQTTSRDTDPTFDNDGNFSFIWQTEDTLGDVEFLDGYELGYDPNSYTDG